MSAEAAMWQLIRPSLGMFGMFTRIENRVGEGGTPDLNFCVDGKAGWIELKSIPRWPASDDVVVRLPHFSRLQRLWLKQYETNGGNSFVLLRVQRPATFMLFRGGWAADYLGAVPRPGLLPTWAQHGSWGNGLTFIRALKKACRS